MGKGKAIVLLHGFMETRKIWASFARKLSSTYRVFIIDLPGHGDSSTYGYCHSMEFMAEAVMAVLKTYRIRRYHIVGHSMGGYVAMGLAEIQADNIRGICMFHSTSQADSETKKKERNKVIKVVGRNKAIFIREAIPKLFNTRYKPYKRLIQRYITEAMKMEAQGIVAALEGMKIRPDRQIVMKFAPYPFLYIVGEHDNILPKKKLISEARDSENASYCILERSGHMGFEEESEASFSALESFLKKTP